MYFFFLSCWDSWSKKGSKFLKVSTISVLFVNLLKCLMHEKMLPYVFPYIMKITHCNKQFFFLSFKWTPCTITITIPMLNRYSNDYPVILITIFLTVQCWYIFKTNELISVLWSDINVKEYHLIKNDFNVQRFSQCQKLARKDKENNTLSV